MAFQGIRRAVVGLASIALLALAGCGSGTIESQLKPTRVVAFGDAFTDEGQTAGRPYTVNDLQVNNWAFDVSVAYGLNLAPSSVGGTNYAIGNARVLAHP